MNGVWVLLAVWLTAPLWLWGLFAVVARVTGTDRPMSAAERADLDAWLTQLRGSE